MKITIQKAIRKHTAADTINLVKANTDLVNLDFNNVELEYIKKEHRAKIDIIEINKYKNRCYVVYGDTKGTKCKKLESYRKAGNSTLLMLNKANISKVIINAVNCNKEEVLAFAEGVVLGNYQFLKYKTGDNKKQNSVNKIEIYSQDVTESDIAEFITITEAVCLARNFVNEPDSYMDAVQLAQEAKTIGDLTGAKVEVFDKEKI